MFHFSGSRVPFPILFRKGRWSSNSTRLPHSEISGSKPICGSPKLIAAYHVLHRLLAPRHSLCALQSLISCLISKSGCCRCDTVSGATPANFAVKKTMLLVLVEIECFQDRHQSQLSPPSSAWPLGPDGADEIVSKSQSGKTSFSLHGDVKERTRAAALGSQDAFAFSTSRRGWWARQDLNL
jgi:hypothetical protein